MRQHHVSIHDTVFNLPMFNAKGQFLPTISLSSFDHVGAKKSHSLELGMLEVENVEKVEKLGQKLEMLLIFLLPISYIFANSSSLL